MTTQIEDGRATKHALAVALGLGFVVASGGWASAEWVKKEVAEGQRTDLAAGVSLDTRRVPVGPVFPGKGSGAGAVAIKVAFSGPSDGYGLLIWLDSILPTMKLKIGDRELSPIAVDHPTGPTNERKVDDLAQGQNILQAKAKGAEHMTFLYDVPADLVGQPARVLVRVGLGTLLEQSKGDFEITVDLPAGQPKAPSR